MEMSEPYEIIVQRGKWMIVKYPSGMHALYCRCWFAPGIYDYKKSVKCANCDKWAPENMVMVYRLLEM